MSDVGSDGRETDERQHHHQQNGKGNEDEQRNADDGDDEEEGRDDEQRQEQQLDEQTDRAGLERLGGGPGADATDVVAAEEQDQRRQQAQHADANQGRHQRKRRPEGPSRPPLPADAARQPPAAHVDVAEADFLNFAADARAGLAVQASRQPRPHLCGHPRAAPCGYCRRPPPHRRSLRR